MIDKLLLLFEQALMTEWDIASHGDLPEDQCAAEVLWRLKNAVHRVREELLKAPTKKECHK